MCDYRVGFSTKVRFKILNIRDYFRALKASHDLDRLQIVTLANNSLNLISSSKLSLRPLRCTPLFGRFFIYKHKHHCFAFLISFVNNF
jgi:hypothetical protein